ncbi:MAG: uroporphyrinogen-III synthase [Amylibacter sp.]
MPKPTLLMIRPLPQARDFVQALTDQTGKSPPVVYSPILQINPLTAEPVPDNTQFLLFTSVNGVNFSATQTHSHAIPALCVGDTTTQAARSAGFSAQSAGGTAQDLVELAINVANAEKGPLIYVSGTMVATEIDVQLAQRGIPTQRRIVYEQAAIDLTKEARKSLKKNTIIPISSPNTANIFAVQTTELDLSFVTFVCISDNAASPIRNTNATQIIAQTPTRAGMITAISHLL